MLTIGLVIIAIINLAAVQPLVIGQSHQQRVWLPLLLMLILMSALIGVPLTFWPTHLWSSLISGGFITWYLTATLYDIMTWYWYRFSPLPTRADYVIVLGAKVTQSGPSPTLQRRLDTARQYATRQPFGPKFVLSGGRGTDEPQTEATAMAHYLHNYQIPESQLLLDEQSTSTATNFFYSKQLIKNNWQGASQPQILVVTSDYHIVRSRLLAQEVHLKVASLESPTTTSSLFQAMIREIAALLLQYKWPLLAFWLVLSLLINKYTF